MLIKITGESAKFIESKYIQRALWSSRYVIAAMLVDGKQKIAHFLVLFVYQHLFISPLLFVSPEIE